MLLYNKIRKAESGLKVTNTLTDPIDPNNPVKPTPKKNVLRPTFLPELTGLREGARCTTNNCSEYTTTEYANIVGLDRDKVADEISGDAWYKRAKVLKNGGQSIWEKGAEIDYSKYQIGDFVSLGNGGRNPKQPSMGQRSKEGYEQQNYSRHSGIIVGKTKDGIPIVRHNMSKNLFDEPINDIRRSGHRYEPLSVFRPKMSSQYINVDNKRVVKNTLQTLINNTYTDNVSFKMADGINSDLLDNYKKNRKKLAIEYAIRPEELDNVFRNLLGISQQESNLDNANPSGILDWGKQFLSDNMSDSDNKELKIGRNILGFAKDLLSDYEIKNDISDWKRQVEIDKMVSNGVDPKEAAHAVRSSMGISSNTNKITSRSKGPFKQKAPSERWLSLPGNREYTTAESMARSAWGKEWDDNDSNYISNAIGLYLDNRDKIREKYKGASPEFIEKATILAHNAPKKAENKVYTDFYIRGIGNNNPEKFNSGYVTKVMQAVKDITTNITKMERGGIFYNTIIK